MTSNDNMTPFGAGLFGFARELTLEHAAMLTARAPVQPQRHANPTPTSEPQQRNDPK